jgi:hypothetical protein
LLQAAAVVAPVVAPAVRVLVDLEFFRKQRQLILTM